MTKLLRQFGRGHVLSGGLMSPFNREHLLRCLGSSAFLQSRRHMNTATQPKEDPSGGSPAPAANPRWLLLSDYISARNSPDTDGKSAVPSSCCSKGRPFRVFLDPVAPPVSSFLYLDWDGVSKEKIGIGQHQEGRVITAHGDSILFEIRVSQEQFYHSMKEQFIYTAGGDGRPPSLSPLPVCYIPTQLELNARNSNRNHRTFRTEDTGLLRCGDGDGELLVAQLELPPPPMALDGSYDTAELCVFRPGRGWELKREVPIVPEGNELPELMFSTAAVPVGNRFLCWVDYRFCTFLVCDMAEQDDPEIQYVPLPVEPCMKENDGDPYLSHPDDEPLVEDRRSMGAEGANAVRFVSIDPCCCCGGHGKSSCARSRFAFRVTIWTMNLGKLKWEKVSELDSDELWSLPGYEGLPRWYLECPVVSPDNPDVVFFMVQERDITSHGERKAWMLEVDTRRKALLSVVGASEDYIFKAYSRVPVNLLSAK